jgi:hypothetical protein
MRIGILGGLACFAFLLLAGDPAAACSRGTLSGVWGILSYAVDGAGAPRVGLSQFTADGVGNIKAGSSTFDDNGSIGTGTFTGAYTLAANCTGTVTINDSLGKTSHSSIVMDLTNKGFRFIRIDSGKFEFGTGIAQGTVACGDGASRGVYSEALNGATSSIGVFAVLGRLTSNGKGGLSGNQTRNGNGLVTTGKASGTYTINSNCTGTDQITFNSNTSHFASVVVNGGSQLLLLETVAGFLLAGTLQK